MPMAGSPTTFGVGSCDLNGRKDLRSGQDTFPLALSEEQGGRAVPTAKNSRDQLRGPRRLDLLSQKDSVLDELPQQRRHIFSSPDKSDIDQDLRFPKRKELNPVISAGRG